MVTVLAELGLAERATSITGLSAVGAASVLAEAGHPRRFAASGRPRQPLTSIPGEVAESVPPHLSASLTRANVLTSMSLPE